MSVPAAEGRRTSPEFAVRRPKWTRAGAFERGEDAASNWGGSRAGGRPETTVASGGADTGDRASSGSGLGGVCGQTTRLDEAYAVR